ncbi:protein of unknown function [Acinetobacter marinus]|uniref:DUF4850 domain-containing protein n=1 Tax=Acinetobacter marinus TaxID=281375 RepID=A0A1G6HLB9_9GAMM|nr:DUF4850 domain-containing protein [Acinetobacter marinus]SDB94984.1 protein of unknown function [Acinetobacter marinus]
MEQTLNPLFASMLALLSPVAHAELAVFEPSTPAFYGTAAERSANNQLYYLGEARFNHGVTVPFYGVTAENPADGDGERLLKDFKKCDQNSCTFNFTLTAEHAKQLKLLAFPSTGLTLVPRQWTDVEAAVGANGTGSALITSKDQKQSITLYDSSFCVGCGLRPATLFFPELLEQSLENEFGGEHDPKKLIQLVHPSKDVAFFSYDNPKLGLKTHGVAKYTDKEDTFNYRVSHVTLGKSLSPLTTPILNFYRFSH